ncbi:Tim44 domain-containing protein, partial [Acinetobacter baumannii]
MEVHQRGLITGILMAALAISPLAEAKRAGGGKSHGMARSTTSSQSYQQPRQVTPVQQPATAPQRSGPGVGSMVAAGVAGAAVGAVAANALADDKSTSAEHQVTQPGNEQAVQAQEEKKGGIPGWLWVLLAAAVAFFVFRKLGSKKKLAANNPYAPNNGGQNPFGRSAAPTNTG